MQHIAAETAIWVPYREAGIDSNSVQFLRLLNLQKEGANILHKVQVHNSSSPQQIKKFLLETSSIN